ncbi:hypothetical protein ACTFIZ_004362 [Dictyostelium cf. discoideum]
MEKTIKQEVLELKFNCEQQNKEKEFCSNDATHYCLNDNIILCNKCSSGHSNYVHHDIISFEEYMETTFYIRYDFYTKNIKWIEDYNLEMDKKNKFLFYYFNNVNEWKLEGQVITGDKWGSCGFNENDPFLIVSFLGFSGSGKSTTVGQLCIGNDYPIPGENSVTNSTSSDINAFLGETNNENKLKYLLIDSEGIGGGQLPKFINGNIDPNVFEKSIENRNNIVQYSYPRLFYIISDVLVFTFKGDPKEKKHICETIKDFVYITSGISNNPYRPHLIILLNKQSTKEELDDIEIAKKDFFNGCEDIKLGDLQLFYKSVSIIYLPNIDETRYNSFNRYQSQMKVLKDLISEKVQNAYDFKMKMGFDVKKSSNMARISKLVNWFNRYPLESPDLNSLGLSGLNQKDYLKDISNNLKVYFDSCMKRFLNEKQTLSYSFNESSKLIRSRLVEVYFRYLSTNGKIPSKSIDHSFAEVIDSLANFINDHLPCDHKINGKECINSKLSHGNIHQTAEKENKTVRSWRFLWYKKTNIVSVPFVEEGAYVKSKAPFDFKEYLQIQLGMLDNPVHNLLGGENELDIAKFYFKNYLDVCVGCLFNSPTIPFSCEHILCTSCSKNKSCCIKGCTGQILYRKDIDFTPTMGSRILSLDGGGIRGILECCALSILTSELFDISIPNLFDLIVGTSSGALVALSLVSSDKTPNDIIETFEDMADHVFSNWNINFFSFLFSMSKYDGNKLQECIKNVVGTTKLLDTFEKTRVAVTSVTDETGGLTDILFYNYYRRSLSSDINSGYINDASCLDACEASSAAPTYFAPFTFNGRTFYDGGIKNNNPCEVAFKEHQEIWQEKKIDLMVSIGTGKFNNEKSNGDNLIKLEDIFVKCLSESEKQWVDLLSNNKNFKENVNAFRINKQFSNKIGLYASDNKTIELLKKSVQDFKTSEPMIDLFGKSISSLFYLSELQFSFKPRSLNFNIKSRITNLPNEIITQLKDSNVPFAYILKDGSRKDVEIKKIDHLSQNSPIELVCCIKDPPEIIDIICKVSSKSNFKNETSISGCPFNLEKESSLYGIKKKLSLY